MDEKVKYDIDLDCTFIKLNEGVLAHCQPFDCGEEDLNDFFANDALAYDEWLMGKTYCWLDNEDNTKIVAMVTLSNSGIPTTHLENNPRRRVNKNIPFAKQGRTYPAVLIGRLGVNSEFQGSDYRIGAQLMDFIKKWFRSGDNKTGCRFIIVDAVNEPHPLRYYERNGFKPLFPTEEAEKKYYKIAEDKPLRTRMYYFDLY